MTNTNTTLLTLSTALASGQPTPIAGDDTLTTTVTSLSGTVSYAAARPTGLPSSWSADGTIASGSSATFTTPQWVWASPASSCQIAVASTPLEVQPAGATFGAIQPDPRQPFKSRIAISPSQGGTSDHIGHLFKSVVDGPWSEVAGDDPNMAWGVNVFTLFQNDQTGLALGWGALIEADVSCPAGITLARITGLQAEASFFGASAGATVTTLESLYVAQPVRKGGATAGTATNVYGLRVGPVRASNVGATTAYGLFVQGLSSSAGIGQSLLQGTVNINPQNAADVSMIVKSPASPTADIIQLKDSTAAILGRFDKSGYFMTRKVAAPADADLVASEMALWLDATNGAAKLMIKAKQADGTVRTGSVALA